MTEKTKPARDTFSLIDTMAAQRRHVCVGLDPDPSHQNWPKHFLDGTADASSLADEVFLMCTTIIRETRDIAAAYKPNLAFFLGLSVDDVGPAMEALKEIVIYAHKHAPDVPVILDGKFGDLSATNAKYARFAYDAVKADAVTVNPYAGPEAVKAFSREGKGVFVLCRMSNPDAGHLQDQFIHEDVKVFLKVARAASLGEYGAGRIGLVTGATNHVQLSHARHWASGATLLIPGIGKQGGDLAAAVRAAAVRWNFKSDSFAAVRGSDKNGSFLVNSSSGIIHASSGEDYAQVAREKTLELHNSIVGILSTLTLV